MTGKLIKHELRSYFKTFLPLWGAMLVLAVVNGFIRGSQMDRAGFFTHIVPLIVLFCVMVAATVLTLLLVLQRFFRGLLGSEGYLVFTLPVTRREIIAAKLCAAVVMETLSVLAALLAFLLLGCAAARPDMLRFFRELFSAIRHAFSVDARTSWQVVLLLSELLVLLLLSGACNTLHLYAAMALGHLGRKQRVALSIIAYVGLSILGSYAGLGFFRLGNATGILQRLGAWLSDARDLLPVCGSLALTIAAELLIGAVLWIITEYILSRRLNLE